MFDSLALAEPPDDGWFEQTRDWAITMAGRLGVSGEALNLLAGIEPETLSAASQVAALAQLTAIGAHHAAVVARYTEALAGPKPDDPREDWGAHEVAVATTCSVYAADRKISFARDLADRLTATGEALAAGRISEAQARLLSESTTHLNDEVAWQVEERMLRFASRQDLTRFKASLRRWLARLDPDFHARAKAARAEVLVEHTDLGDGTGELWMRGPLEHTAAIHTALTGYANGNKSRLRGTAQHRMLAGLTEWAEAYATSPEAPRRHGRLYGLSLIIDTPTMLGLANHPAEIPGYGMLPADAALTLLADGSPIRRLITDEHDGHLLHYGTTTYRIPPPLADHLIALHHTAASPHSLVPAAVSDLDHNIPHDQGGPTDPDNITPQDRRWHRAKTHAGWTYAKNKDGTVDWTSPLGQTHREHPHDYRLGP